MSIETEIKERVRLVLAKDPRRKAVIIPWMSACGSDTVTNLPLKHLQGLLDLVQEWENEDRATPLKLTEKVGPVQEVAARKIVDGKYGPISVWGTHGSESQDVRMPAIKIVSENASVIRQAAAHLTSIADFLEADNAPAD